MISFLGAAAAAIDFSLIALAKNQIQISADAAALAGAGELTAGMNPSRQRAQYYVGLNEVGGRGQYGTLSDQDVVFGLWDKATGSFTGSTSGYNSVRVTVRKRLNLVLGAIYGRPYVDLSASAVGVTGPRDIAFVIDLSGSMNNDTEIWATSAINSSFAGFPTIGTQIMQKVFTDFSFGTYPGTVQHVAQTAPGAPNNDNSYNWLANTYLLNNNSVATKYKVLSSDSSATRKTKAYSWLIDTQIATIMPNAKPTPSSTTNLAYWTAYLDYVIKPVSSLPPSQNSYRIDTGSNPYTDAWPTLTSSTYTGFQNKIGYQTYVQFMMDYGRTKIVTGTKYANISTNDTEDPLNLDNDPTSAGYGLSFSAREQPTHSVRLAVLAAINQIAAINAGRPESAKDHVCLITFDTTTGTSVRYPLSTGSCDYNALKTSVATIQAAADDTQNTASESGLLRAKTHLDPTANPSGARPAASKVVVFLSDGIANAKESSNTTISSYITSKPSSDWFTSGTFQFERNAAIMQAYAMQLLGYRVYPVGVGLGADRSLMDRMARISQTATPDPNNPNGPKVSAYSSGNPGDYQQLLTSIFASIVGAPSVQLGQ